MKGLTLSVLAICCAVQLYAQTYTPFPESDAQWITKLYNAGNGGNPSTYYHVYTMQGDTLINDTLYHKVYFQYAQSPQYVSLSACMREQDQRVYVRPMINGSGFNSCINADEQEFLIYDFTIDEVGDSLYLPTQDGQSLFVTQTIDSVLVGGEYRTRWTLMPYEDMCSPMWYTYIEGVGSERHPFGQLVWMTWEVSYSLSCMTLGGEFQYSFYPVPPLCDIDDFIGIEEMNMTSTAIYTDGSTLHLDPRYDWRDAQVSIYNGHGQCLADWQPVRLEKDLGEWAIGMYLVRVRLGNGSVICKKVMREN